MRAVHLGMRASLDWLLVCFCGLNMALAGVEFPPGDNSLIRERQERLLDEQCGRLHDLLELPGKKSESERSEPISGTRCFPIHEILITGAEHLSDLDLQQVTSLYLNHCLGTSRLNDLLKTITSDCLDKGLVTSRACLPQQDLSSGVLKILVVEWHLEKLQSATDSGLYSRELTMSFPGRKGESLNQHDMEQMVDQLNRLPSNQAQMERVPVKAAGVGDVLVWYSVQKPWRASSSHSNDVQKSTGEQQWWTSLDWDSPLVLADQLMLRGGHYVVSDHQRTSGNAYANYSLPYGWWIFNYSDSLSDYRSKAQANGFGFKQTGDSQNHQLHVERVIHRDVLSKTSMIAGLSHLRTNNVIERQSARAGFQQCLGAVRTRPTFGCHRDIRSLAGAPDALSNCEAPIYFNFKAFL